MGPHVIHSRAGLPFKSVQSLLRLLAGQNDPISSGRQHRAIEMD
jgi:hypothetical protein